MDGKDGGPSHDAPWSGYLVRKRVDPSANPKEGSGDYKIVMVHYVVWQRSI